MPSSADLTHWRDTFLRGEDTPRALLERTFENIRARDGGLKAFVSLNDESARVSADAATSRYAKGESVSVLDGCPIAVKDIIETEDLPTQMGSDVFAGWKSGRDAACVQALRDCGAVIVGKTHTTEFAIGRSAPTTNPHDASRTPGGSSSGSAAAVGAGLVPLALGTQTVGSILRPASFCGAFGFKPTHGALSMRGIHPLSGTLDHLGPIGTHLQDVWACAHAISNAFGGTLDGPTLAGGATLPEATKPQRLGFVPTDGWDEVSDAARNVFEQYLASLRRKGVEIVENDAKLSQLNTLLEGAGERCVDLVRFEMRYPMRLYLPQHGHLLGPRIRALLEESKAFNAQDHAQMLQARARLRAHVLSLREHVDGFITLASSGIAPNGLANTGSREFLAPWTLLGGPTYALPVLECEGLPFGAQLMGFPGSDRELTALARWAVNVE